MSTDLQAVFPACWVWNAKYAAYAPQSNLVLADAAGDRYLIKLFRDFVFHQVNEAGGPLLDWGHVIEALNKLDLGVSEKIMLLSRDEMSMLLVSYADVKQCINTTFKELEARAGR